jgi:hypothetical protein
MSSTRSLTRVEVVVERRFFSDNSPAISAFDYLGEQSRVRVRVIDFIHGVLRKAFGKRFKEDHPDHYANIDHLFQCRNKVAHTGDLFYREKNSFKTADYAVIAGWWDSVMTLINWLG